MNIHDDPVVKKIIEYLRRNGVEVAMSNTAIEIASGNYQICLHNAADIQRFNSRIASSRLSDGRSTHDSNTKRIEFDLSSKGDPFQRLASYERKIARLEEKLRHAEERLNGILSDRNLESKEVMLFRRVGLNPASPSFVIKAARRAYRVKFHPDQYGSKSAKQRAEEILKQVEFVFDEIYTKRDIL